MIPRVSRLGTGFVSAGLYYLHDKRPAEEDGRPSAEEYMLHDKGGAQTSGRLGFVELRNLPVRDPDPSDKKTCYDAAKKALRCMAWVAAHAKDIRQASVAASAKAAGLAYDDYVRTRNPYRGRKGEKPLYSLSIAWHPTKNNKPTHEQMIAAADEVLEALGMADRQCVILSHHDRPHPHVHLIINRVSPQTGLYAKTGNDYLRVSAWALEYERRTGLILCTERMFNWERRNGYRQAKSLARRDDPRAKGAYVRGKDVPRGDRDWWKAHERLSDEQIRAARKDRQEEETAILTHKAALHVLIADARISRTLGKQRNDVLKALHALKTQMPPPGRRSPGLKAAVAELFRTTANAITGKTRRRRGAIERLHDSARGLTTRIDARKKAARDEAARAWTRLEKRHAVERARDEQRMEQRRRQATGRQTGDRALAQFNLRGDPTTARHVQPQVRPLILTHAHVAAASPVPQARKEETLLARLARKLGWKRSKDLPAPTRERIIRPEKGTAPAFPRPPVPSRSFEEAASPRQPEQTPARKSAKDVENYEKRVEKNLARQERAEQQQQRERRKRKRPRSKARRMGDT
jgi:relaxase-like protein